MKVKIMYCFHCEKRQEYTEANGKLFDGENVTFAICEVCELEIAFKHIKKEVEMQKKVYCARCRKNRGYYAVDDKLDKKDEDFIMEITWYHCKKCDKQLFFLVKDNSGE